ncbi:MDR family MFS transporter [Actinomadura scrupuli]|uniref:MDR family MFS transporter n=1 Tax=Actinomadura scrupuli TaxID=559629 RepID=UPI003D972A42
MKRWHGNQWAILLTLSLGFFMTLLDLTIVNIAIPSMIDKLHASLDQVLWVMNAYILILAVLLITCGRLGDLRGPRTLFVAGVAVFTVASLLCGISQTPAELIGARVIQGLGAALLLPQTMTLIISTFPADRRGAAMGVWGAVAGVATIAGPTVGGLLVTALDWRWIFFVNLPVGLLVLVMAIKIIPDVRPGRRHKLDLGGVSIATAALFCLVFGLTEGQRYEWNVAIWSLLGAGVLLLVVFVLHQRSRQDNEPLVPFALFRDRNFTVMNFVAAAVSVGMIGIFLPMTIYLQSVQGYSALKAGLVMAPASLVSMFLAPVAGRLSDKIGGKYILMGGLTLYGLGTAWIIAIADVGTDWTAFLAPFIVTGIGIGGVFAPMATVAMRNVEPRMAGAASGFMNTIRQVGSVIGSAAVGAVMQSRLASALKDEAATRAGGLPAPYRGQFVEGFQHAAKGGLEVGAGQTGIAQHLPANVPAGVAAQLHRLAGEVFSHGFVQAMKPTMGLPVLVVLIGAAACLGIARRPAGGDGAPGSAEAAEAALPG